MDNGVDVLAVIRYHEQELRAMCGSVDNELQDVHAAVAELIEGLRTTSAALEAQLNDPSATLAEGFAAADVARAALARVKGVQNG